MHMVLFSKLPAHFWLRAAEAAGGPHEPRRIIRRGILTDDHIARELGREP